MNFKVKQQGGEGISSNSGKKSSNKWKRQRVVKDVLGSAPFAKGEMKGMKVILFWSLNMWNVWLYTHRWAEQDLKSHFSVSLVLTLKQQAAGTTGKVEMTRKFSNMPGSATLPWKVPFSWPANRLILSGLNDNDLSLHCGIVLRESSLSVQGCVL